MVYMARVGDAVGSDPVHHWIRSIFHVLRCWNKEWLLHQPWETSFLLGIESISNLGIVGYLLYRLSYRSQHQTLPSTFYRCGSPAVRPMHRHGGGRGVSRALTIWPAAARRQHDVVYGDAPIFPVSNGTCKQDLKDVKNNNTNRLEGNKGSSMFLRELIRINSNN